MRQSELSRDFNSNNVYQQSHGCSTRCMIMLRLTFPRFLPSIAANMHNTASCWKHSNARHDKLVQLVSWCLSQHHPTPRRALHGHASPRSTAPSLHAVRSTTSTASTSTALPTTPSQPSPYKHITHRPRTDSWQAQITIYSPATKRSRCWHLGTFASAEDAAVVTDLACWLLGRPVANFPHTDYSSHPVVASLGDVQGYVVWGG